MEEKKKEHVFNRGVVIIDLENCIVLDRKLQCDSTNLDDDEGPNTDGIGVCDGHGLCSQIMDSNDELASRSVAPEVGEHSESILRPQLSTRTPFLIQLVRPFILML